MKTIGVDIYFCDEKSDILIASFAQLEKSVAKVMIEPLIILDKHSTNLLELGENILKALEVSEKAQPVNRSQVKKDILLDTTGIKSFPKFSKNYRNFSVEKTSNNYIICENIRESRYGGYNSPDDESKILLDMNSTSEIIGNCILKLLNKVHHIEIINKETINTLEGKVIEFIPPSEDYINAGDGHTDAYQIYRYFTNNGESSYFGFFYANDYTDINEEKVEKLWEKFYGNLNEFVFKADKEGIFEYSAYATTEKNIIFSHFFQEEDNWSEFLLEIDKNAISEKEVELICKTYLDIRDSCKYKSYY